MTTRDLPKKEKLSQKEKILRIMVRKGDPEKWWYPYELMHDGDIFVGYKAPTRISELALECLDMIESKVDGKYNVYRFRFENSHIFLQTLPAKFKGFVQNELDSFNVRYTRLVKKVEIDPIRNVAVIKDVIESYNL